MILTFYKLLEIAKKQFAFESFDSFEKEKDSFFFVLLEDLVEGNVFSY